jgi:hypothetical protein
VSYNFKNIFLLSHGSAEHLRSVLEDSNYMYGSAIANRVAKNPQYDRSHVDALLAHESSQKRQMAFQIGKHITNEDVEKHILDPEVQAAAWKYCENKQGK